MFLSGFVRPSVWMSMYRASQKGVPGNLKGEGRLLGGGCLSHTVDQCIESLHSVWFTDKIEILKELSFLLLCTPLLHADCLFQVCLWLPLVTRGLCMSTARESLETMPLLRTSWLLSETYLLRLQPLPNFSQALMCVWEWSALQIYVAAVLPKIDA